MDSSQAQELFLKASWHNWDSGIGALKKILKDPNCDLGTALLIYWRGRPEWYCQYAKVSDAASYERPMFRFLRALEERIVAGDFSTHIRFDPKPEVGLYKEEKSSFVRTLPALVYKKSGGRIEGKELVSGKVGPRALHEAAASNDLTGIKRLLKRGLDIDKKIRGRTPLSDAAGRGRLDAAKLLLKLGADPHARGGQFGWGALHASLAWGRSLALVEALLDAGVSAHAKAKYGTTPLHLAAQASWKPACALLIARGARVDRADSDGRTAVHLAAAAGALTVLKLLGKQGGDLGALDNAGKSALHHALAFPGWNSIDTADRTKVVEFLLESGLAFDQSDLAGSSVIALAKENAKNDYLGPKEKRGILAALARAEKGLKQKTVKKKGG